MPQSQDKPDVPEETPEGVVGIRNRNGDAWYEHDGELLWSAEDIERIHVRLVQAAETDWSRVQNSGKARMMGNTTDFDKRVKIRTQDQDDFKDRFEELIEEAGVDWLTPRPKPDLHEKGPRRTDAWIQYNTGRSVAMGGSKYKRQKILVRVRQFEDWLFHTQVIQPVFEEFNEKYPY